MLKTVDLYEQGSKCCQQYSALTMQVRTLAQHVLLGYAVGVGLAVSRVNPWPPPYLGVVLLGAGLILMTFGCVLWVLNHHHSTAFRAIRNNVLAVLEREVEGQPLGPWSAHRRERREHRIVSWFAWHLPFLVLVLLGGASMILGVLFWVPS